MSVDLTTEAMLHSRVVSWNATHLARWVDALYAGDVSRESRIEDSLLDLMRKIELRVNLLATISGQSGLFPSLPEDQHFAFESLTKDVNKCLRDMTSLRPVGHPCPIRSLLAECLQLLRSFGGLRENEWS